jgi:hypothetical protein
MSHGSGGHEVHHDDGHGTTPIEVRVPITMTNALDSHPILSAIVADRALAPDFRLATWVLEMAQLSGALRTGSVAQ